MCSDDSVEVKTFPFSTWIQQLGAWKNLTEKIKKKKNRESQKERQGLFSNVHTGISIMESSWKIPRESVHMYQFNLTKGGGVYLGFQ